MQLPNLLLILTTADKSFELLDATVSSSVNGTHSPLPYQLHRSAGRYEKQGMVNSSGKYRLPDPGDIDLPTELDSWFPRPQAPRATGQLGNSLTSPFLIS